MSIANLIRTNVFPYNAQYEICAAMLLSEEEFFENKSQIVSEVLEKLHQYARLEAELLFREFEIYGGSLPQLSKVISGAVNAATDALASALESFSEEDKDKLLPLFRAHLPKTMADLSFDHVRERVPSQYITNAIASCLGKSFYSISQTLAGCLLSFFLHVMHLTATQHPNWCTRKVQSL